MNPLVPEGYKLDPMFIEKKDRRVQLLLQPSVHEAVRKIARSKGYSFNDYVNTLLKKHAENYEDIAPIYVWGGAYTKLVVLDTAKNVELAAITEDDIDTASPDIVVKLTPKYN